MKAQLIEGTPTKGKTARLIEMFDHGEKHRQSRVINRDYVRKWALDYAHTNKFYGRRFERVSERFLNAIERITKEAIIGRITRHPSKGKTLM